MQVGIKRTFNFAKGKNFEVKEIIDNAEEPFEWEWNLGKCPHCNKEIKKTSNYTLDKIEILEDEDGEIEILAYTKEKVGNSPFTFRLPNEKFFPEKSMKDKIKAKSKFLKEKYNG